MNEVKDIPVRSHFIVGQLKVHLSYLAQGVTEGFFVIVDGRQKMDVLRLLAKERDAMPGMSFKVKAVNLGHGCEEYKIGIALTPGDAAEALEDDC